MRGILMLIVPVLFVQHQVQAGTSQTQSSLPSEVPAKNKDKFIRLIFMVPSDKQKLEAEKEEV